MLLSGPSFLVSFPDHCEQSSLALSSGLYPSPRASRQVVSVPQTLKTRQATLGPPLFNSDQGRDGVIQKAHPGRIEATPFGRTQHRLTLISRPPSHGRPRPAPTLVAVSPPSPFPCASFPASLQCTFVVQVDQCNRAWTPRRPRVSPVIRQ